ncbi:hypothetical protein OF83DRAFT_721224 [Amylostereum chailletii]|nr:hypothetical protein OF83DRAFT_721224 [Amylostereum chailletii]
MLAVEGAPMDVQGVEANVDAAAGTDKGKDAAHDAPVSAGQEEHPSTSTISAPAHLPETPPELLALLDVHRSKKPVSLVVASSSPMFPWKMAGEVGYVWAGLFSIIDVKEETSSSASPLLSTSKKIGEVPPTVTVRRTWTFTLSWTAGGEEYLRDGPSAWFDSLKYPWWEVSPPNPPPTSTTPAPNTRPSYNTLSDDSDSDMDPAEIIDAADAENYCTVGSILPVGLLTPFGSMCSTEDAFPHGFYCPACGRLNVQRFLRHRACESTRCRPAGGPSTVPASGWSFPVGLIRDARHMEPSIFPDFSHVEDVRVQSAEKGELQLYRYMLPPPPLKTEDDSTAPSNRVDGPVIQHLFTGNNRRYQEVPDMLFEQLQLDVRLERKLGEAVFSDAVESFDGEANSNGPAAACYEGIRSFAVEMVQGNILGYERCKLGKLSIRVWVTEGKSRDMFRAESRTLVVVLLGADLDITYNPKDPNAVKRKAVKGGVLRFTMVHGDMLVVTGGDLEVQIPFSTMACTSR